MILGKIYHNFIWHLLRKYRLKRWKNSLQLNQHEEFYKQLFAQVDGFALSKEARRLRDAFDYTYGEIDFISFIALLFLVKIDENTVFYDLGSGIGTAVLACAMVYPVKKSIGIEYFALLHEAAICQKQKLIQNPNYHHLTERMMFINNDFLHTNMDDATLIFINSTAYFGETWEKINRILEKMPHLQTVITLSKCLNCLNFTMIQSTEVTMGWGTVQAYIHQRHET